MTPVPSDNKHAKRPAKQKFKAPLGVLPATGFVRLPTILSILPIGPSNWWAGIKDGRYPAGVKISPRVTAWPVESIRTLVEALGAVDDAADESKPLGRSAKGGRHD